MTIWKPEIAEEPSARYLAIADALAGDIAKGRLHAGERLPTHRELADALGIAIGTVTRAYAEAERRGLVRGEVGRGTFVGGSGAAAAAVAPPRHRAPGIVDLSLNFAVEGMAPDLAMTLRSLAARSDVDDLLRYQPHAGSRRHRGAGAAWAERFGLAARPEQVLVSAGAQHAMMAILSALAKPGDHVLTEALTYPGVKALATLLHLSLDGIAMDDEGIEPEALEEAVRTTRARILYVMPTIHNPAGGVLSEKRRRAIAELLRAHDLVLIEDDVHRFLLPDAPPPIAALAPERVYYIAGTSKAIAGGLRVAFVVAPDGGVEPLARSIWATTWMAAPLMAEIATIWIEDGTAARMAERQRAEAIERQRLARALLGPSARAHPSSLHVWWELPEPWRGESFARAALQRGVAIAPAELFVVGRGPAPRAVRIGLGPARDRDELEQALRTLIEVREAGPQAEPSIV
jgi:DNA-binding transcriptional MocR family regulator